MLLIIEIIFPDFHVPLATNSLLKLLTIPPAKNSHIIKTNIY